jgi:hypothetical protein
MAMCRGRDAPMSDKQKKFQPTMGFVVAVHQNAMGIRSVSKALGDIFPERLGEALEMAGYQLVVDPFDLSADATKLIAIQEKQKNEGLHIVRGVDDESGSDTPTD